MNIGVLISSLMLAFDDPFIDKESQHAKILVGIDVFFTILFASEALIKIIALGFLKTSLTGKTRNAYMLDPWNRLDFFLVIV